MFDIGFPELMLISVVALVVIGPDKLPETVRTIALWIGRFKRSLSNIRMELENEIGADEIRQQLHNENIMKELSDTKSELEDIIQNADNSITGATDALKNIPGALSNISLEDEIDDALEDPAGLKRTAPEDAPLLQALSERSHDQSQTETGQAEKPHADFDDDVQSKLTGNGASEQ